MQLTRPPRVLTLHLKRFRAAGRLMEKVGTHVPFPSRFDARPFCCGGEKVPSHIYQLVVEADSPAHFELFGVVEHAGSFLGGHYTAFVRTSSNPTRWHHFSDTHIKEVAEAAVLGAQAFLLFYCYQEDTASR